MNLPFTRPDIDEATIQSVVDVLRSGWLASGPRVLDFEAALSREVGGRPVRTMTSATAALEIALLVAGVGPGDEVVVPAISWCATANVVVRCGARPVFVDVDLDSRNVDLDALAAAITPRTRALLPVHFAGLPVDLDRLYEIARRHGLRVVEDAAHAIGSAWKGVPIGAAGDLVCFSFHPNKNITTGDGGAIVATDPGEVTRIEQHRFNGVTKPAPGELDVLFAGMKANMSDIAAAIGLGQLPRLARFNARRRELAYMYFERFGAAPLVRLPARGGEGHSWHMFTVLLPLERMRISRQQFIEQMAARGISLGIHYPAMHLFTTYRALGWTDGQFPNAERIGRETVTLPLFPAMPDSAVERVVTAVDEVVRGALR
jgi:dTDP-4-amino-4,6-dideoxygalactose transaminase